MNESQWSASCFSISMTEFSLLSKRVMEGDVPASLLEYIWCLPIRRTRSMAVEGANLESPVRCKSVSAVLLRPFWIKNCLTSFQKAIVAEHLRNRWDIDSISHTKGLRIYNSGMSFLCRLQEKIKFPPYILRLSSKKNFHLPLFVGSRYFLIQDALRDLLNVCISIILKPPCS